MAKAQITMPGGIVVSVSGTPDEITAIVSRLQGSGPTPKHSTSAPARSRPKSPSGRRGLCPVVTANCIYVERSPSVSLHRSMFGLIGCISVRTVSSGGPRHADSISLDRYQFCYSRNVDV